MSFKEFQGNGEKGLSKKWESICAEVSHGLGFLLLTAEKSDGSLLSEIHKNQTEQSTIKCIVRSNPAATGKVNTSNGFLPPPPYLTSIVWVCSSAENDALLEGGKSIPFEKVVEKTEQILLLREKID